MDKKLTVIPTDIEKDIANALLYPPNQSEASYKKWQVFAATIGLPLGILAFFRPFLTIWLALVWLAAAAVAVAISYIRQKVRTKNVSISDYEIHTETVSHTIAESNLARVGRRHSERINNYTVCFENGKN